MPAKYQLISANTTEEMVNRIRVMTTQGFVAVGSLICSTREQTIQHSIKGAIITHETYLKQAFWYAPNVDSAFSDCLKQYELLQSVVNNATPCYDNYEVKDHVIQEICKYLIAHHRGAEVMLDA